MEKETWHVFISLFLVHGRGGLGLTHLLQRLYTLYKLHEAKKPGKFFLKSPEFPM
jgi:Na+(H+)/acetate symporter ActP